MRLHTIFKLKCPKCYKGNLFTNHGLFVVKEIRKMNRNCSHCSQDFKIEPNFYSAASWIKYPIILLIVVHLVLSVIALNTMYGLSLKILIPIFMAVCLAIQVPIIRISKAVLINLTLNFIGDSKKA
ncbi:DUF983 domain-containing protein [Flavobacterium sp. 140616W15]|nr:DUF983 domain-containing protein [Flavobacterium sp. 140616W15]